MFYPAAIFAAWFGGLLPGLLATVTLSSYSIFFLRPHLLSDPLSDMPGFIRSTMFLSTSVLFTILIAGFQRALHKANFAIRKRDEFLSLASHELKTPITGLLLQNSLRKRKLENYDPAFFHPAELEKMIAFDLRNYQRIARLVNNMLDISRLELGKLPLHISACDLSALTNEVTQRVQTFFPANNVDFSVEAGDKLVCDVDPFQIEQVLVNLLSNAVKYGKGSPVVIRVEKVGEQARITVTDQGPGIALADQKRIFEKFERAVENAEIGGMGLGLYICKSIANQHHGNLVVNSAPGKGASFILDLPLSASMKRAH